MLRGRVSWIFLVGIGLVLGCSLHIAMRLECLYIKFDQKSRQKIGKK